MKKKYNVNKICREIKKNGYCKVSSVLSVGYCKKVILKLEKILTKLNKNNSYYGSNLNQVIYNYFYHDIKLIKLASMEPVDAVMKNMIDKNYVLIAPSARNPRVMPKLKNGKTTSGFGWHVDSKVADSKIQSLFKPSMNYYAIICLEDFTSENSSTHYIPRSHLSYKKPKKRNLKMKYKKMTAKTGSIIFFDSALWHQVGQPTEQSRWSIFNMYGPWFMKPYFQFSKGLTRSQIKKLNKFEKKLIHLNSTPPINSEGRLTTLIPI